MLGSGLQFNRSRNGEDRFYSVAKARRNQDTLRRAQTDVSVTKSPEKSLGCRNQSESDRKKQPPLPLCNLERFIQSVTPSVTAQYLSKTTMRGLRTCDVEFQPYFVLGDLWESFKERSAYGAGVPLILNDSDSVVQYYVPYLSGIQLYRNSPKSSVKSRRPGEDSDGDYSKDSSSEGNSDSEHDRGSSSYLREQWDYQSRRSEIPPRMEQLSLGDQNIALQEGFSSDEGESGKSQGCLVFQYFEEDQPRGRGPLADKISELSLDFPEIKTLRSCDLMPSSWISVAWYPIYRIPTGPSLKDLDACFLTFHSLHTPMTGTQSAHAPVIMDPSGMDDDPKILLPVFGLSSYKFNASTLWTPNGGCERQLVNSLWQAADNWLRLRQVNHPDFLFFCRR